MEKIKMEINIQLQRQQNQPCSKKYEKCLTILWGRIWRNEIYNNYKGYNGDEIANKIFKLKL